MNSSGMPVFVRAPAFELGEPRPISALAPPGDPGLKVLADAGLEYFRASSNSVLQLSIASLAKTLKIWGEDPSTIDAVIFCSESRREEGKNGADFVDLLDGQGLKQVPLIGLDLSACAVFAVAVRMARSLIRAEGLRNVAIITADKCLHEGGRIGFSNGGVYSDGAASCILSSESAPASLRVLGIGYATNHRLRDTDPSRPQPRRVLDLADGVHRAIKTALDDGYVQLSDIGAMISTTTRRDTMEAVCQLIGLEKTQIFTGTVANISHCYSADLIINLSESREWRSAAGFIPKPLLALTQGPHTWGALVLTDTKLEI